MVAFAVVVAAATIPVHGGVAAVDASRIVDSTETISLRLPDDWRDINPNPTLADNGEPRGQIFATPDQFELQTTGRVPWVWASVVPAPADSASWLANNTAYSGCVLGDTETFDNGNVIGTRVSWRECAGRTASPWSLRFTTAHFSPTGRLVTIANPSGSFPCRRRR